jgi:hypothetical protein
MPIEVYDVDGNPVEGLVPLTQVEEAKAELQAKLDETNASLAKLQNKDFNFRKLEQMTEEEKNKLSATELSLKQQQEKLEEDQKAFITSSVSDIKTDAISRLAGDDEELKKKIEYNFARLKDADTAKSRQEISSLMQEAYTLSTGSSRMPNPINAAVNHSGAGPAFVPGTPISADAMSVGKSLGLSEEDIKKYS